MSARPSHVAAYGRLTALYPRSFRDDYRADLVALFSQQLRDERPGRVWLRAVRDLAVTVPVQHLEAHMTRPSPHIVTLGFGVVAGNMALLALIAGTAPVMPVFAGLALVAGVVAYWSWQSSRTLDPVEGGRLWWKLVLAGATLAALTLVAMAIPWPEAVDLGDNAYWAVVFSFMASLTLAATGLLLGLGAWLQRRRTRHAGASPA